MIARAQANFQQTVETPIRGGTLSALELGMAWFPEQPGGMDRYFYDLMNHLPAAGVTARGLVCGSAAAEQQSNGIVRAASASESMMLIRFLGIRKCVRQDLSQSKPDVIAAHFAVYAWPVLGLVKNKPPGDAFSRPLVRRVQNGRRPGGSVAGRNISWKRASIAEPTG